MRRSVITLTATVAGVAGVLLYHPASAHPLALAPAGTGSGNSGGTAPSTGGGSASGSGTTARSGSQAAYHDGTVTGPTVITRWGPVQVQVHISGGKITDVQAVQLPNGDQRSMWIGQQAQGMLRQEVLQAQSANVDMISGATYTSTGYLQSLQSALDSAHG